MTGKKVCKFDGGELELRSWEQPLKDTPCPKGLYYYYACKKCGYIYSLEEVDNGQRNS